MIIVLSAQIVVPDSSDESAAKSKAKDQYKKTYQEAFSRGGFEGLIKLVDLMGADVKAQCINYAINARNEAANLISGPLLFEVVDQYLSIGEASNDLVGDYSKGHKLFKEIVGRDYPAKDALEILTQLKCEVDRSYLIDAGEKDYEEILANWAANTYGNAVLSDFEALISEVNEIEEDGLDVVVALELMKQLQGENPSLAEFFKKFEVYSGIDEELCKYMEDHYPDRYQALKVDRMSSEVKRICE